MSAAKVVDESNLYSWLKTKTNTDKKKKKLSKPELGGDFLNLIKVTYKNLSANIACMMQD